MKNFNKELPNVVVFDIDNTIYDGEKKLIHSSVVSLIKKLSKKGNIVGVATGRTRSGLDIINEIKPFISFYVLANGMEVRFPKETIIYENYFSNNDTDFFLNLLNDPMLYVGFGSDKCRGYLDRSISEFAFRGDIYNRDQLLKENITSFWLVSPSQELINKTVLKIRKQYDCFLWTKNGCDIVKKGHNKYFGVTKVIEKLVSKHNLICVGDGENDLELIKNANLSIGSKKSKCQELIGKSDYLFDSCYSTDLYNIFLKLSLI